VKKLNIQKGGSVNFFGRPVLPVALAFLMMGTIAFAATDDEVSNADANSLKIKNPAAAESNSSAREDIDQEITNARLRASTGAKSLFSVQSALTYNGSSIDEPLAQSRPQLSPGTIENDPAKLTGSVSVKYRVTDHDNINLGVGVGWITPTYLGQRGQVEDPYLAYGRLFRVGDVQNVLNVSLQRYTAQSSVNSGHTYESDIDHTFLISVGKTKLQLGIDVGWTRDFYDGDVGGVQDELFAYPFGEYSLTDKVSLRTVYRGLTYYNTQDTQSTFVHDASTQSLGIGFSVTRDVYLYPNVQWVWDDVRSDKTNVALSANINM
jgi:hypothetical protein